MVCYQQTPHPSTSACTQRCRRSGSSLALKNPCANASRLHSECTFGTEVSQRYHASFQGMTSTLACACFWASLPLCNLWPSTVPASATAAHFGGFGCGIPNMLPAGSTDRMEDVPRVVRLEAMHTELYWKQPSPGNGHIIVELRAFYVAHATAFVLEASKTIGRSSRICRCTIQNICSCTSSSSLLYA